MLTTYIQAAMHRATYELLDDGERADVVAVIRSVEYSRDQHKSNEVECCATSFTAEKLRNALSNPAIGIVTFDTHEPPTRAYLEPW